jgi:hypothetical protein
LITRKLKYLLLITLTVLSGHLYAQRDLIRGVPNQAGRLRSLGNSVTRGQGQDSLKRRDKFEDSLTIRFRYLDSTRNHLLDSSISDYSRRFPVPATNIYLGNVGSASRSILFSPLFKPGWDPGLHAFDVYKWKLETARFFNTTRPYSELNYVLGGRSEQQIEIMHTQNIKPNWNFLLQYRLINAPGFFKNQKTNHNNYLFTTWFQSENKRYNLYAVALANKLQAGENGGISDLKQLDDPIYKDRFNLTTRIGGDPAYGTDFFSTDVGTGNRYKDFSVLLRQQYDLGQKDSVVSDSTVIPLFYPRLRFEHTIQYSKSTYNFRDYVADSGYYAQNYGIILPVPVDSVERQDQWKEMINDFSIYTYPDAKNIHQFLKIGASLQSLALANAKGTFDFYNVFGHAEYRNRSRNQKWDINAAGKFYFTGLNSADYQAQASLQRSVGKRQGYVQLGFENVNRTPSFIFDQRSNFYLLLTPSDFKKENTTHLSASLFQPRLKLKLSGHYYLLTNYTYLTDFYQLSQESTLFNVLQIAMQKTIRLGKNWNWHADVYYQQVIGNAPVNVPTIFTRNRIGYEGNLGFKNLDIAFGAELRYHTAYKADDYSPVLGKFFYQDSVTVDNPRPDVAGYVNFRIRSFKFYFRAENLNTAQQNEGFNFTKNNLAAPNYPYPGLLLRLGIYWSFVN